MPIKALFILLFVASATPVFAQNIELENFTISDKNSKVVYIGIENVFAIKEGVRVKGIEAQEGVALENGRLCIRANVFGQLPVTFLTEWGREVVTFEVMTVSSPVIAIGNWTDERVDKDKLLQQGSLRLTSFKNGEAFFEGYQISSFQVEINGQTFSVEGNAFSREIQQVIQQAKAGDWLTITNVKAFNKILLKKIDYSGTTSFRIQ